MRRALIVFLVLLLSVAVPCSVLSKPKASFPAVRCVVTNPHHTQALGGRSRRACIGLRIAAARAAAVKVVPDSGKGGIGIPDPLVK